MALNLSVKEVRETHSAEKSFHKITLAHLLILITLIPFHMEVSITALLSNYCKSLQWLLAYIQLCPTALKHQHVPFCMSLFVKTPDHSAESLMLSEDKKASDYRSYPKKYLQVE